MKDQYDEQEKEVNENETLDDIRNELIRLFGEASLNAALSII